MFPLDPDHTEDAFHLRFSSVSATSARYSAMIRGHGASSVLDPMLSFRILGPVAVLDGGTPVHLASQTQRVLLAVLLIHADQVVSHDRLVDALWEDKLPDDPPASLRTQLSRLRKVVPPSASIDSVSGGYRLRTGDGRVDAVVFEALLTEARRREPATASLDLLDRALSLWQGDALEDLADRPFARAEAVRLNELRAAARERRGELLAAAGRYADAVADLEALLADQPQREGGRAKLMTILYELGRHTEAVALYQSWRVELAEHGLEPAPELRALEREILAHAPGMRGRTAAAPRPTTTLFGRDAEIVTLAELLNRARHVTLWGPGGVGKSRLAVEVAHAVADRYPDGVHYCDLGAVARSSAVARSVATTLGVHDKAGRGLEIQLIDHLAALRALVILDGCEHVLTGVAPLIHRIVTLTPASDVIATSRVRLEVDGEQLWEVSPLDTKDVRSDAVALFVDRARATRHDLGIGDAALVEIAEICRRLDGLPLAIELAAARVRGASISELLHAIDQSDDVLTAGPGRHARHRSLAAVLEWSYRQLSPMDQQIFDRLGVFAGGFTMDDAVAVVRGEGPEEHDVELAVLRLLDCSLVAERPDRPLRYTLLDTMRRSAVARLTSTRELDRWRDAHARWAVDLARHAAVGLGTGEEPQWARLVREHLDEIRAAHAWLVGRDARASLELVVALRPYAHWRGASEVFRWAEVALAAAAAADMGHDLRAPTLFTAFTGAWQRGDDGAAQGLAEAIRVSSDNTSRLAIEAEAELGLMKGDLGPCAANFSSAAELALLDGDLLHATWDLGGACLALAYQGKRVDACEILERVDDLAGTCRSPSAMSFAAFCQGELLAVEDPLRAEACYLRAIELAVQSDARFVIGLATVGLVAAKMRQDDVAAALDHCATAINEWHRAGSWAPLWITFRSEVALLIRLGAHHDAAVLLGAAEARGANGELYGADAVMLRDARAVLLGALGATEIARATAVGVAMTAEEVVAHATAALDGCRPHPR